MQIVNLVSELDGMVTKGQILEAIEKFFAGSADTIEVGGALTKTKQEKASKLQEFLGGIQTVNGITLIRSAISDNVSYSEYKMDFDMKDGSKILWHEIIRREWKDGLVVHEQYFQN
jgi:hypothetical protein